MKLFKLIMVGLLFFIVFPHTAYAAPSDMPTRSVTDNSRTDTLGIFANNQAGINMCWSRLAAGTARFYAPTDVRGFDATARTRPLEADTCAHMRVRGGLIGVVALREGSLVNLGQRDGREQPVAYNMCNNWLELLERPVTPTTMTPTTVEVHPTTTTREVVDTVIVHRRTVVRYVDTVVYETAPITTITVPPTQYRYVESPQYQAAPVQPRCICYWPPDDPSVTQLYRFPYPDRNGQWWCVPLHMAQTNTPPPGFVR